MSLPNCYRCSQPVTGNKCGCKDGIVLIHGDCLEVMAGMDAGSVQTCVTSPPYWNLRDYGVDGQLGLEATPEAYVAKMVEVFRGVRRVLRDDGTVWLNLGDAYNSGSHGGRDPTRWPKQSRNDHVPDRQPLLPTLKPKDLVGIPWRVAFALQADGWYLRQDIIWHKPNPMPESVTDRCTKAHEYLFLLSKSARYYWDAEAVREAGTRYEWNTQKFKCGDLTKHHGSTQGKEIADPSAGRNRRSVWSMDLEEWIALWHEAQALGDVWKITTKGFKGAHFATFPPDLIEPCIKAGTSEEGCCPECGAPWVRETEKERVATRPGTNSKVYIDGPPVHSDSPVQTHSGDVCGNRDPQRHCTTTKTTGWRPGCECLEQPSDVPMLERSYTRGCVVLDPFLGSGTTAAVARKNGCRCVGIELNEEYLQLAARRLEQRVLF